MSLLLLFNSGVSVSASASITEVDDQLAASASVSAAIIYPVFQPTEGGTEGGYRRRARGPFFLIDYDNESWDYS